VTLERVVTYENLREAFRQVNANGGAPGPDGRTVRDIEREYGYRAERLRHELLTGRYRPQAVRRVWIPKGNGGKRGLGIPNVEDRWIQQALLRKLAPVYERTFHGSSHGFRTGRSCHTAIAEAKAHVADERYWMVDIDLEKFFDRVPHQRLLAKLRRTIRDERIVRVIGQMLRAGVVMPDGVVIPTEEGTPQGGPLSPLLSNIVLDELDHELAKRGHRFVRYADDLSIYVKSERAGKRVFESVARFLEQRMKLVVNRQKSAVSRPRGRHVLGFSIRPNMQKKRVELDLSKRTRERLRERIRELTPRNHGQSLREAIRRINRYLRGWAEYFGVAMWAGGPARYADGHIRRRLRAILLQHWKKPKTIRRKLTGLGSPRELVERGIGTSRGPWKQANMKVVTMGLRNEHFEKWGLLSLEKLCAQRLAKGLPLPETIL
jgi:group II intron reverse transcriptase/maturase